MATEQLELPIEEFVDPEHHADETIQQRFDAFHRANPWVYEALVILVRDWVASGRTRAGMKQFIEVIRWEHGRRTDGDSFRLNNNHTSRYARLLVEHHPEWAEVFQLRELRAE